MSIDHAQAIAIRSRAKHLIVGRQFKDAVDTLSEGLKLFPNCYKMHRLRSLANACLREYVTSHSDAEKLIALRPTSSEGYYFKGFCLYHKNEYLAAATAFAEGLERAPFDRVLKQAFWDAVTLASQRRMS